MNPFEVKVPATIANLGPGFDVLGFAIDRYLTVKVSESGIEGMNEYTLVVNGEMVELPLSKNAVFEGVRRTAEIGSKEYIYHKAEINSNIHMKRGLGSSAAARVAGLIIGNRLLNLELTQEEIAQEVIKLEGHPDNAVPALLGGVTVNYIDDNGEFKHIRRDMDFDLRIVVGVPQIEVDTNRAREALPEEIKFKDAVFSNSRSCLLMSALYEKRYDLLKYAMQDKLHQPYRKKFIPEFDVIVEKTVKAGGYGTAISGSGPSVFSFVQSGKAEKIGRLIVDIWKESGVESKYFITSVCNKGVQIIG